MEQRRGGRRLTSAPATDGEPVAPRHQDAPPAAQAAVARVRAVRRLLSAAVITASDAVDRGITVRDASRANEVLLVEVEGGSGAAVKSLPLERCARELIVHDLAAERPRLAGAVPRLLAADADLGWMALELVVSGETLTAAHRSAHGYPVSLARAVGRALGAVHHETVDLAQAVPAPLPWVLFALERTGPGAFVWEEAPLRAVLDSVGDLERVRTAIAAARDAWTPGCLVHGDFKWDNCLLSDSAAREPEVRIIDWESAGTGDPAWDVAGIVQEYLVLAALLGLDVAGMHRAGPMDLAAVAPLADALRAFFTSYAEVAQPDDSAGLAARAVLFTGVRLVQTSLEHASAGKTKTPAAAALFDLALAMLEQPDAVASRLPLVAVG